MKKPTKAERHQIYKDALIIFEDGYSIGLCSAIHRSLSYDTLNWGPYGCMSFFPELWKRKPIGVKKDDYWWKVGDKISRIRILKECIEESTPKIKKK